MKKKVVTLILALTIIMSLAVSSFAICNCGSYYLAKGCYGYNQGHNAGTTYAPDCDACDEDPCGFYDCDVYTYYACNWCGDIQHNVRSHFHSHWHTGCKYHGDVHSSFWPHGDEAF